MAVFRFLAAVFLLVATVALVDDATPAVYGARAFTSTSLSAHWQELGPSSFASTKNAISSFAGPGVWDIVFTPILGLPTYVGFAILALLSGYVGRRRRAVRIFVN